VKEKTIARCDGRFIRLNLRAAGSHRQQMPHQPVLAATHHRLLEECRRLPENVPCAAGAPWSRNE
jgi:hypothetical protein